MAIQNIPLWPFEPNWSSSLTEVLEWMTDVMTSPTGSEQRRSLRYFPRRTFEYSLAVAGAERSLLDNLLTAYGAQRWYLPLWHDINFLDVGITAGEKNLVCGNVSASEIKAGSVVVLMGESAFSTELVEVESVQANGLKLVNGVALNWPIDTKIFPVRIAKFTDQPEVNKRNDEAVTTETRFLIIEPNPETSANPLTEIYRGFAILSMSPDDRSPLNSGIERMLVELDNKTSTPIWQDTASRPFTYEQYMWVLHGRSEQNTFRSLLQNLRGRAQPLWVPTFMTDMILANAAMSGDTTITVEPCGFTQVGGPRPDRQDIMIETLDQRIFRRVTASALYPNGNEAIAIDQPLDADILPENVMRISFMTLMRLNQDSVTIEHQTDSNGLATSLVTFRSAPDTRVSLAASF